MSKFSIVIIIILLSVAVTVISGILLPTYLSRQILELRKELNSKNSNSKYSLQANVVPIAEGHNQSNKSSLSSQNVETEDFRNILVANSITSPEKAKKRSKRQAVSGNDYVTWNFNFNLTEHRNPAVQESSEIASGASHKTKPLGIAIFTEGESKKKTAFSDIQYSLDAVEYFFKYLLNAENYTREEKPETGEVHSETELLKLDAENGIEPPSKGREGKFFSLGSLNIFGFRTSSEKISSTSPTDSVFKRDELTTVSPQSDLFTGNSQENPNLLSFQAQSLTSEKQSLVNVSDVPDSNLPGKTEDGECIDCDIESPETQVQTNELPVTQTTSTEFTDDFLEMFCMRLVNKVEVSQHLSDSEGININPEDKTADRHDVESSSKNQLSDVVPTLASEKDQITDKDYFDYGVNDTLMFESDRQKKFLSSILGFGSGRAADDETNEFTSEVFSNAVDLSNLRTVIDCENYFREKNFKMFSKPNFDIISDTKIKFADFTNATISSKLNEQQLDLTGLLKTNLGNTDETLVKNSDAGITKSALDETLENDSSTLKKVSEMLFGEPNDLIGNTKVSIRATNTNEDLTTELQRDGRFFNVFGWFSGGGESRSHEIVFSTDKSKMLGSGDLRSLDFGTDTNEFGSGGAILLQDKVLDSNRSEDFGNGDSRSLWAAPFGSNENELGSGNLRSLEDTILEIDKNEFGSGDSRSLRETVFETEINELGSGDFRSFGNETSGIDRNEFVSGESRLLETIAFGTDRMEFGSGESFKETSDLKFNSTNKQRFGGIFGLAGSGDGRDLLGGNEIFQSENKCENNCTGEFTTDQLHDCGDNRCNISSNEKDSNLFDVHNSIKDSDGCDGNCLKAALMENKTFGELKIISSDDHIQNCQGCNNESLSNMNRNKTVEVSECDECTSSISSSNKSSFKQQNLQTEEPLIIDANQGITDKRTETNNITTNSDSSNDHTDKENVDSKIRNQTEILQEQTTDNNTLKFLGPIFLTGSGDGLFGDRGGPINLPEEEENTSGTIKDDNADGENMDSKIQNVIENTHDELTTEKNTQRFLGPIFLTGSGDGGLFEDSGGPIILIEEETTVKSQNVSLRKARLNDPIAFSEAVHESSMQTSKQDRPINGNITTDKFTSPIPSRRGRVEDNMDEDYEDFIENYRKNKKSDHDKPENITDHINKDVNTFRKRINTHSVGEMPMTNIDKIPVTVSTDVIKSKKPIFPNLTKSQFQTRPCTAARECNVTLNERCITVNSLRVCGCSKGYARSIETSKCVVKKIVQMSIKLPSEHFEEDLRNSSSPGFQQKRKSSVELMILLMQHDPELLKVLSEIDEVKFSSGSLVITASLVFAAENKSEAQLIKRLEDGLQTALRNETLSKRVVSLDISDASLLSVNGEIDYCKSSELNYCSEYAYCVSNPALPAGYACQCKEHYRDASFDPRQFGETCLAKCPKEYCGSYGHCELMPNDEKICLCSGLYFGRRCEVPGLYVLIILGCIAFISITMLILVVSRRRCSRFSYRESQADGSAQNATNSNASGKVSDAIALEESIGTTRFMSISTPMPHPAIKLIRPTITGSGSSCEFDSTFDSNQSALKTEEDTTV